MEDKQLNFNQPILSVRRFSSAAATQKNDRWKNESFLPTKPPVASLKPELKSGQMGKAGSIPFVWEHSPGRPKDETRKQSQPKERPPILPKLPPGRILPPKNQDLYIKTEDTKGPVIDHFGSRSVLPTKEKVTKFEGSEKSKEERSDSGDEEEYMDALDTLSRGESLFYNCSLSGVSGLESDVKRTGVSSTDPKTRDLMMDRFLPAAKAMASEVPQHAPKKHLVEEKPWQVKKVDNTKPQLRYGPNFLQDIDHDNDEEDSDYDYDEPRNTSYKVCGLLPRFCLKGSFNLLNPVLGSSMRTRLPISRTHASSSSASSFSETENEPAKVAIYEHRSLGGSHLAKHQNKKSESTETTNENNISKLEGSGVYNRLQGGVTESCQSSLSERKEWGSLKKGLTSFKELLAEENKNETVPKTLAVEKTLYVDTVHKVESPKSNSLFREYDTDILKALDVASESLESDFLADKPEQDINTKTQTGFWKGSKVDLEHKSTNAEAFDVMNRDKILKVSRESLSQLPAPPPLPKSPSDSWLWRTLPSVTSKHTSLRSNPKNPSSNLDSKSDEKIQGLLLPIPEI